MIPQPAFEDFVVFMVQLCRSTGIVTISGEKESKSLRKTKGLHEVHAQNPSFWVFNISLELPFFSVDLYYRRDLKNQFRVSGYKLTCNFQLGQN